MLVVAAVLWTRVEVRKTRDLASSPDPLAPDRYRPPSISTGADSGWAGFPAIDLPLSEVPPGPAGEPIVESSGSRPPVRPAVADPQDLRPRRPSPRPMGRSGRWGAYRYDAGDISAN